MNNYTERTLTIVRGLPGSGKTTKALRIWEETINNAVCPKHFEADMYFSDKNGVYVFDPKKLPEAHKWCQDMFFAFVQLDQTPWNVIISNTFTETWELLPYVNIVLAHVPTCVIHIVDMLCQYQSIHNIPAETMDRMARRKILGKDICMSLLQLGCTVKYTPITS
jgi:hypothetical protein